MKTKQNFTSFRTKISENQQLLEVYVYATKLNQCDFVCFTSLTSCPLRILNLSSLVGLCFSYPHLLLKNICSSCICCCVKVTMSSSRCTHTLSVCYCACMYACLCERDRACLFCQNHVSRVTLQPSDPDIME